MTSTAVIPVRRLEAISSRTWEHPADRAALAAMRAIPGFDEAIRKIVGAFGERGEQGDALTAHGKFSKMRGKRAARSRVFPGGGVVTAGWPAI